jgi:hypothetical protein
MHDNLITFCQENVVLDTQRQIVNTQNEHASLNLKLVCLVDILL